MKYFYIVMLDHYEQRLEQAVTREETRFIKLQIKTYQELLSKQ